MHDHLEGIHGFAAKYSLPRVAARSLRALWASGGACSRV